MISSNVAPYQYYTAKILLVINSTIVSHQYLSSKMPENIKENIIHSWSEYHVLTSLDSEARGARPSSTDIPSRKMAYSQFL